MTHNGAHSLAARARRQSAACGSLGSPFYARLLELAALDIEAAGVGWQVLAGHRDRPADDVVSLRLLGSVHRLVLSGQAPALRAHYPNVGGDGDADAAWPEIVDAIRTHRAAVLDGLTRAPQTNEVGRAAGLIGALHHLVGRIDRPVRLLEIGASGGLNLRADAYRVTAGGGGLGVGPADSAVVLAGGWDGEPPPVAPVRLVDRRGCDLDPVDPATDGGALTLLSYVWPDQSVRWHRLLAALEIARRTPAQVVRAGAADFLAGLAPAAAHWTVVWHSVMWQYLDADEKGRVDRLIGTAGSDATATAPVARVALEPYGARFLVVARTWPDIGLAIGREILPDGMVVVGHASPHGVPIRWV